LSERFEGWFHDEPYVVCIAEIRPDGDRRYAKGTVSEHPLGRMHRIPIGKDAVITREMALCLALSGLTATAMAQPTSAPETWTPINPVAQLVTGRVTFTPSEIAFQNGKSLSLAPGGQTLFRPEPKKKKVLADLYRVTPPDDPVLENGNKLCKSKFVVYLLVWKSEKTGKEADPRTLAPFSGQKLSADSSDDCGRYVYDAGPH
jgi:hypothetical protein